jgi:protein tyrosine phosphatase (PTP) superfamily phosphohydrolase (DUF442 family)
VHASCGKAQVEPLQPLPGIENPFQVTETLYSGGVPEGPEAFAALAKLGVKTVVSVDGMRPNVELARQHGLRYVHIPLPYSGVSEDAALQLTRVMRELEGPVFVHCHHGKHRGPAAAAICALGNGSLKREQVLQYMQQAGTGQNYRGLWLSVQNFESPPADKPLPELQEVVSPGTLAEIMVHFDEAFEPLQGWAKSTSPPQEAELAAAKLLTEETVETLRHAELQLSPELRRLFEDFRSGSEAVEAALQAGQTQNARQRIQQLAHQCQTCHRSQRDNVGTEE